MDLVSLRLAAGGGSVDGSSTAPLVAAGFALLQRSATLVRALAGRRAAILLPPSAQFVVALAASDGRGALLVDPTAAAEEIAFELRDAGVGAVFTVASLSARLPAGTLHVLLDQAPSSATVVDSVGASVRVDLGSHFGLSLEGESDVPGRDEECLVVYEADAAGGKRPVRITHRELLAHPHAHLHEHLHAHLRAHLLPQSRSIPMIDDLIGPLLSGARVTTTPPLRAASAGKSA